MCTCFIYIKPETRLCLTLHDATVHTLIVCVILRLLYSTELVKQYGHLKQDIMSLQTLTHLLQQSVWATLLSVNRVLFHHFLFLFQVL